MSGNMEKRVAGLRNVQLQWGSVGSDLAVEFKTSLKVAKHGFEKRLSLISAKVNHATKHVKLLITKLRCTV